MPNPPFGMPKILFEPYHNSSEATRGLGLLLLVGKYSFDRKRIAYNPCTSFFPSFSFSPGAVFKQLIASCCLLGRMCYIPCLSSR